MILKVDFHLSVYRQERERRTGHTGKNHFHLNEHPRGKKLSEKKNVNKDDSCFLENNKKDVCAKLLNTDWFVFILSRLKTGKSCSEFNFFPGQIGHKYFPEKNTDIRTAHAHVTIFPVPFPFRFVNGQVEIHLYVILNFSTIFL